MSNPDGPQQELSLAQMQTLIRGMYGDKDEARGIPGTFMWLMEEVGELSSALRENEASGGPATEALAFELFGGSGAGFCADHLRFGFEGQRVHVLAIAP